MYKLTIEQKDLLLGQFYAPSSLFNPVMDQNGDWFISSQEINGCVYSEFDWVKNLPQMEYTPPVITYPREQKIDMILTYLKSELTDSQFRSFLSDCRNYLIDYTYYSDSLYYWIDTSNSPDWGDYTSTGFKTKTTYRGDLVDGLYPRAEYILQILSPSI